MLNGCRTGPSIKSASLALSLRILRSALHPDAPTNGRTWGQFIWAKAWQERTKHSMTVNDNALRRL